MPKSFGASVSQKGSSSRSGSFKSGSFSKKNASASYKEGSSYKGSAASKNGASSYKRSKSPTARKGYSRTERVAGLIHRILSRLICVEFKDPRIGMITLSSVEVSPNLAVAKVYVTVFESEKAEISLKILNEASGYFRSELARAMDIRVIPKPRFILDGSTIRSQRITTLLDSLNKS